MRKLIVTIAIVGLVTAFGGGIAAAGPSGGDADAFCQARVQIEKDFMPFFEAFEEGEEPDQDTIDAVNATLDELDATAPPEIAAQVTTVTGPLRDAIANGFESDPFQDPAVGAADREVTQFIKDNCGFEVVEVTGGEYVFDGVPKSIPSGPAVFTLTNEGGEVHELMIVKLKGKQSVKKLAKLSEDKLESKVEFVNEIEVAPGESDSFVADLEAGRYGLFCHVPVGTTSLEGEEEGGGDEEGADGEHEDEDVPTHAEEGMFEELKVK